MAAGRTDPFKGHGMDHGVARGVTVCAGPRGLSLLGTRKRREDAFMIRDWAFGLEHEGGGGYREDHACVSC